MDSRPAFKTLIEIPPGLRKNQPDKSIFKIFQDRTWKGITSKDMCASAEDLAIKLLSLGIKKDDTCAIFSENRPEWLMADFAIMSCGAITVPLHTVLPVDQVRFILKDSESSLIFVSNEKLFRKIQPLLDSIPELKWIILFAGTPSSARCIPWEKALADGSRFRAEHSTELEARRSAVLPDDVSTIIYTSGTTGDPKGVMLTHRNFLSNMEAVSDLVDFGSQDVALSVLPVSHILERMSHYTLLSRGATVAYGRSFETLQKDFVEIMPTCCVVVPRILEVMQAKILAGIGSSFFLKRAIFSLGLKLGMKRSDAILQGKRLPIHRRVLYAVFRLLAFRRLHSMLGGRFRFFIAGGAALSPEVGRFFHAMGVVICEGYGLTETSPVIAVNTPHDLRFGTVGKVLPGVEVRISEEGEILARGPNVMKGYYRNERATAEAFRDGWFCTGDMGEIIDGYLAIGERKKNLIVTSSGKNVAPQRVEAFLKRSPLVGIAVVFGDTRSYISALIVPDFRKLGQDISRMGIRLEEGKRIIDDERIIELFRKEISQVTKPLASYEKVRRFALLGEEFTIEKGEITPTLKVRRDVILKRYKDVIDSLYERRSTFDLGDD